MEYLEATQTQILEKQYLVFEDNWNIFKTNHCFGPGYALSAWQSPICTRCKGKDIYYAYPKLHKFLGLCVHLTSTSIPHNLLHLNYVSWYNIEFWSVHYWLCLSSVHCALQGWLEKWNIDMKHNHLPTIAGIVSIMAPILLTFQNTHLWRWSFPWLVFAWRLNLPVWVKVLPKSSSHFYIMEEWKKTLHFFFSLGRKMSNHNSKKGDSKSAEDWNLTGTISGAQSYVTDPAF